MAELYTQNPGVGTQTQQLLNTQQFTQGMTPPPTSIPQAQQQLGAAQAASTMAQLAAPSVYSEAKRQYGTDAQIPQSAQAAGNLSDMFRMYVADVNAARGQLPGAQPSTPTPPPGFEGARMPTEYRPMLTQETLANPPTAFYNPAEEARFFGSALGQYRDISSALADITGFNREELARQLQGTERSIAALTTAAADRERRAREQLDALVRQQQIFADYATRREQTKNERLRALLELRQAGFLSPTDFAEAVRAAGVTGLEGMTDVGMGMGMNTNIPMDEYSSIPAIAKRDQALSQLKNFPPQSQAYRTIVEQYQRDTGLLLNPQPEKETLSDARTIRLFQEAQSIMLDPEKAPKIRREFNFLKRNWNKVLDGTIMEQIKDDDVRTLAGLFQAVAGKGSRAIAGGRITPGLMEEFQKSFPSTVNSYDYTLRQIDENIARIAAGINAEAQMQGLRTGAEYSGMNQLVLPGTFGESASASTIELGPASSEDPAGLGISTKKRTAAPTPVTTASAPATSTTARRVEDFNLPFSLNRILNRNEYQALINQNRGV